jgi:ATP-dependent Lon protease
MPREMSHQFKKDKKDKKQKKSDEKSKRRKSNEDSDSDEDISFTSDSENDDDEMDQHEYRKFLAKMFPSKYMNKKVKAGEKLKKIIDEDEESDEEEEEEEQEVKKKKSKSSKKNKKQIQKKNKKIIEEDDEEDDDDDDLYEEEEGVNGKKLNIIFTIGQAGDEDEEEWVDDDDGSEWDHIDEETENEDESVSTDDDDSDDDDDSEDEEPVKKSKKVSSEKESSSKTRSLSEEEGFLAKLKAYQETDKDNSLLQECIDVCQVKITERKKKTEKKQKKQKQKNGRIFKKLIRDKNTMNDFTFFGNMETAEQIKVIKEVREINKIMRVEKPYRMTLLESNIPPVFKAAAMKKINSLRYMEPGSGEFYKIKNWVDTFMRIPFNKFETLPITIDNGVDACHEFMEGAQKTLDSAVYGLNDAKMQIMQMLGQLVTNPSAIGTAIAIHGPPGTGKTSLVKEGISKILNRPFSFIALGGATDSSYLEGHSYTYEGSVWGKIVQILIDSKCMNPVIYFDELDKISDTPKGEEIAGILTHLTDTSQNSQFHDKYFSDIDFDLSKCLFIFSYNDESKVNPILKDRMYRIETKGYDKKQKTVIANDYLLPKIREQVRFSAEEIIIPEESVHHIIDTHCNKEDGVRNLKRCFEIIHTKLNLYRLMKPGQNLFEGEMALKVEFPFTVTKDIVDTLIKKDNHVNVSMLSLYV